MSSRDLPPQGRNAGRVAPKGSNARRRGFEARPCAIPLFRSCAARSAASPPLPAPRSGAGKRSDKHQFNRSDIKTQPNTPLSGYLWGVGIVRARGEPRRRRAMEPPGWDSDRLEMRRRVKEPFSQTDEQPIVVRRRRHCEKKHNLAAGCVDAHQPVRYIGNFRSAADGRAGAESPPRGGKPARPPARHNRDCLWSRLRPANVRRLRLPLRGPRESWPCRWRWCFRHWLDGGSTGGLRRAWCFCLWGWVWEWSSACGTWCRSPGH
jgi:hypothetical protein